MKNAVIKFLCGVHDQFIVHSKFLYWVRLCACVICFTCISVFALVSPKDITKESPIPVPLPHHQNELAKSAHIDVEGACSWMESQLVVLRSFTQPADTSPSLHCCHPRYQAQAPSSVRSALRKPSAVWRHFWEPVFLRFTKTEIRSRIASFRKFGIRQQHRQLFHFLL